MQRKWEKGRTCIIGMRREKMYKTEFIWGERKRTKTNEGSSRKMKRGRETKGRGGK